MMLYELDDIEKSEMIGESTARPGELIQEFWCDGCEKFHEGSVLGGPIGNPHGEVKETA